MDARQCVTDPNILIAEVEPLPVNFASAFAVLVSKPTWTPTITPAPPPTPAPSFINKELTMTPATSTTATTPSSITATTTKKPSIGFQQLLPSATMISTTSSNSSNFNGSLIAFQTPLPHPSFHQLGSSPSPAPSFISPPQRVLCRTAKYVENVLSPRDFLFKSYLNSKFQGHYVFRVHGDQVEYAKLHVGLEQACSQYFREADVTYRAMESKAKVWREERKAAQAKREREFEEVRESVALQSAAGLAQHRGSISRSSRSSISSISGISISSQDSSISSQGSSSVSINTSKDIDGDTIDASSRSCAQSSAQDGNDGDQSSLKSSPGMILNHEHLQEPSDTLTSSPEPMNPVPLIVKPAVIPKVTFDTIADADEETTLQPSRNDATSIDSADRVDPNLGTASAMKSTGRRHPFTIQEQEGMEQQLWAIDNGYWNGIERDHNEETRQAVYGLEMYMMELVKTVEYERFDLICNIEILNESRDTTLFSIMNGDKTNLMFLESPSVKQKHEFLNWIAISLMDHGEPEEAAEDARMKSNRPSYIDSVVLGGGKGGHHQDLSGKDVDNLLDLANVRLSLLVTNMRDKHDETQITMKQIEYFLEKLDNLDENSKKLETEMVRVLDSHELRSSLQPSPTTGLTLTQTVEAKVKDVNERIVVCARIMTAARLNVNFRGFFNA
ncbi:hypothetical protein BGZ58_001251 [Dissophora ornata]|nr:hypothetical protein BGZ58_001251 [Dissophora ornata]